MKTIGATQFKQQCLSLLEQLEPEGLIVTKRGKPVARVIPYSLFPTLYPLNPSLSAPVVNPNRF